MDPKIKAQIDQAKALRQKALEARGITRQPVGEANIWPLAEALIAAGWTLVVDESTKAAKSVMQTSAVWRAEKALPNSTVAAIMINGQGVCWGEKLPSGTLESLPALLAQ